MKWRVDRKRNEAMTAEGYLISWAESKHGFFYNGYGPVSMANRKRKHIEASYNRQKVKDACEAHLAKARQAA